VLPTLTVAAVWLTSAGTQPNQVSLQTPSGPENAVPTGQTPAPPAFLAENSPINDAPNPVSEAVSPETVENPSTGANDRRVRRRLAVSWVEALFDGLDHTGEGLLNTDEMPPALRAELKRWARTQDGLIARDEFRRYAAALVQPRLAASERDPGPGATARRPA